MFGRSSRPTTRKSHSSVRPSHHDGVHRNHRHSSGEHYVDTERSNAGLKGAINNPRVSNGAAKHAKEELRTRRLPRRDIPSRSLMTYVERLGYKLGLRGRAHSHTRSRY